jgi:hypothetical protein
MANDPREFKLYFDHKADNPQVQVWSKEAYIKYNEVIHVIDYSAYKKLQKRISELEAGNTKNLTPR